MKMTYGGGFVREIDRCRETDEALRQLVGAARCSGTVEGQLEFLDDGSRRWTDTNTGEVVITAPKTRTGEDLF